MRNDNKNRFSFEAIKNSALAFALVSATCVPAVAFATTQQANIAVDQVTNQDETPTSEGETAGDLLQVLDEESTCSCEGECLSNEEYVNALEGLSDAEKQELIALYDKLDAAWESALENVDGEEADGDSIDWDSYENALSDDEHNRMAELENKAYVATLVGLSDAEKQELLSLYNKESQLSDSDEGLTDEEYDRICTLEDKAYYAELEQLVKEDTTLTDAERSTYLDAIKQMKELDKQYSALEEQCDALDEQYLKLMDTVGDYFFGEDWDDFSDEDAFDYSGEDLAYETEDAVYQA